MSPREFFRGPFFDDLEDLEVEGGVPPFLLAFSSDEESEVDSEAPPSESDDYDDLVYPTEEEDSVVEDSEDEDSEEELFDLLEDLGWVEGPQVEDSEEEELFDYLEDLGWKEGPPETSAGTPPALAGPSTSGVSATTRRPLKRKHHCVSSSEDSD